VSSVYYGDRLSRDFDHVEAVLRIGKNRKAKESIYIRNETLERPEITEIGALGALDCIATHLMVPNEELRRQVGRMEQLYLDKANVRRGLALGLVDDEDRELERLAALDREWKEVLRTVGGVEYWAAEEVSCSRSTFYEVLLNEYKNRIVSLQGSIDADRKYKREWLLSRRKVCQEIYGKSSEQSKECEEELLNHDSLQLREDTGKYIQFLRDNNEKPTRKFCRLGKDTNTVDDIRQIQRPGGGEFRNDDERAEHVRTFYVNLYKKKIDRILEIESIFTEEEWLKVRTEGKRLDENVKQSLEGGVTL
jgi:hypothetical protein